MDFVSPLVSRLGVVAAYVAFAFVGAIVLFLIVRGVVAWTNARYEREKPAAVAH